MNTIFIFALFLLTITAVYCLMSIKIFGPDEMGVKTKFGKPVEFLDSGWYFIPWIISRVYRYSKQMISFHFTVPTATTRTGKVKGYGSNKEIGAADVDIFCVLSTYFAQDDKLFETLKFAPGAGNSAKKIGPFIVPYVLDVVRAVAGSLPWPLIDMEREKLVDYILARIIPNRTPYYDLGPDADGFYVFTDSPNPPADNAAVMGKVNPLVQFGLDLSRTSLSIENADLNDKELAKLLTSPEKARLEAAAKVELSISNKTCLKNEGDGKAYAREKMIEAIKDYPDLELLDALKGMAQGTSNTILYQLPAAFENRMKNILGGNDPKDFLKNLTPGDWKKIQNVIKNLKK